VFGGDGKHVAGMGILAVFAALDVAPHELGDQQVLRAERLAARDVGVGRLIAASLPRRC
jgi:hypothetical protein